MKTTTKARTPVGGAFTEAVPSDWGGGPVHTGNGTQAAFLTITKVVREHHPLPRAELGQGGLSIGQMLDDMMADVAASGGEVQSLELEVTPEYWHDFAEEVRRRAK